MSEHSQHHDHMCFCACTNPVVNLLKNEIFGAENLAQMTANLPKEAPEAVNPEPMLITGGIIRPMIDGKANTVEAIGFAEGKVVAVGSLLEVSLVMDLKYMDHYVIRNLEPHQTLLPGLFEPHIHVIYSGIMASWVDVGPFSGQNIREPYTKDWVLQTLNAAIPSGEDPIVFASGLDPALLTPYSYDHFTEIDYKFLNEVSDTVPVMVISASGHTVYLNSPALCRIYNANIKDLQPIYGSEKDFETKTRGLLQEQAGLLLAFGTFNSEITAKAKKDMNNNLDAFFAEANSRGVTSMYDALLDSMYLQYLTPYVQSKNLRVRLGGAKYIETNADLAGLSKYVAPASYSDIYYGHVKIVSDGSNQGLTGYQSEGYACQPDNFGIFDFKNQDEYQNLVDSIMVDKGWPLMIHANGDKAVSATIDVYRQALKKHVGDPLRNRIEHCSLLSTDQGSTIDQIDEMVELGISPSFLIGHVGYWGYVFQDIIFKGQKQGRHLKSDMLDLCQSALKKNLRISLHSDHTVTPIGPLRMMEQSITRVMEARPKDYNQKVLNERECLSAEQALRAVTYDAAWQCYADKWAGSLANNHFADFIILEKDPLSMPAKDISMNMRNITVEETWLGGVMVYRAIL